MAAQDYTRLIERGGYYSEWLTISQSISGGLVLAKFEPAVVLADNLSATDGLSLGASEPREILDLPQGYRKAKYGELLGTKVGDGVRRFEDLPFQYPFTIVNYPNKSGRKLGTEQIGATHLYRTPYDVHKAIFGPPYQAPSASLSFVSGASNGTLYKVGADLGALTVRNTPTATTYNIIEGNIYMNGVRMGMSQTPPYGASLAPFNRTASSNYKYYYPTDPAQRAGYYSVHFSGDVADNRPTDDGGPNVVATNSLDIHFTLPYYFGMYRPGENPMPTDATARGAWLQNEIKKTGAAKTIYEGLKWPGYSHFPGAIQYGTSAWSPIFVIPKDHGPLSSITDPMNANLMLGGDFQGSPTAMIMSETNVFTNVDFLVYTTKTAQYGLQTFNYNY